MTITEKYEGISSAFWRYLEEENDKGPLFKEHYSKTYEKGLFDTKTKRLMAMVGALAAGCEGCILGQASKAIENGATKEEVLEACSVAFSLGGTMAGSKIAIVIQLMKEKGMM
ncbi:carboxymuconolactone decarboxylase family protein [Limisalsivibrio acetivorans]|uniref:carboxymuconolactone decarboxylase family protein n=1 Tax=Limisalsivibrio acetivorans TaxID=1304888 RepID=UPI0003B4A0CB|nr:carboxymuconolactone decarboxylase family protein [Limisalsivibrio acetivorans]